MPMMPMYQSSIFLTWDTWTIWMNVKVYLPRWPRLPHRMLDALRSATCNRPRVTPHASKGGSMGLRSCAILRGTSLPADSSTARRSSAVAARRGCTS